MTAENLYARLHFFLFHKHFPQENTVTMGVRLSS